MQVTPGPSQFSALAEQVNTIPVFKEIAADPDTPVSAFLKLHRGGQGFLLESVEGGNRWGRYSILGTNPLMTLRAEGGRLEVNHRDGSSRVLEGDPLDCLASVLEPFKQAETAGLGRFAGGFVGYLAYDLIRTVENLPLDTENDLSVADIAGVVADNFILFDNVSHTMKVVSMALCPAGVDAGQAYDQAVASIDETIERLRSAPLLPPSPLPGPPSGPPASNLSPGQYGQAVERAKEYIRAGDIIQVVLSQRYSQPVSSHPFSIYRALRTINPSPYMYYLDLGQETVVGASPEVMVRVEGKNVAVRPIAGTTRRGRDEDEDRRLVEAMLADPKEQAEHVMLLDLGRNDVGKVSEIGSVCVEEQMTVERYSHVNHIVSHVSGRLKEGADRIDAFRATFPAGTLSGAPKVRAMEIIEELETTRRGIYGGAIGYLDFRGNMDTAIAIRTVLIKNDMVYMQVGAGIVADSDPTREQAECEEKGAAMLLALEKARDMEVPV